MNTHVNLRLLKHFASAEFKERVAELAARFEREHFVEIESFVPDDLFDLARRELLDLHEHSAHRRDLVIPSTANTPRRYSNLDRDTLAGGSTVIPAVFRSTTLLARL